MDLLNVNNLIILYRHIICCINIFFLLQIISRMCVKKNMYIYMVSDNSRHKEVFYHFANFVIINEILIFEDCRKEACSAGPSGNASPWRDTPVSRR